MENKEKIDLDPEIIKRTREKLESEETILSLEDITTTEERAFLERNPDSLFTPQSVARALEEIGKSSSGPVHRWFSKLGHFLNRYRYQLIGGFVVFIVVWVILNIPNLFGFDPDWIQRYKFLNFDPFPFKTLNFFVSSISAVFSQIVLIAQKKMEERDRKKADLDLELNLKQEIEIKLLTERIELLKNSVEDLTKIHITIVDLLQEIRDLNQEGVDKD